MKHLLTKIIYSTIILSWIAYLGVLWFGSTDYNSHFERASYKEIYSAQLDTSDIGDCPYKGEYLCQLEKVDGRYTINWIVINDKKYDAITEDDYNPKYTDWIDIDLGIFDIKLVENLNDPSFQFSRKSIGLTILTIVIAVIVRKETRKS
ncbi:hypothetical protein [Senimuribacter intestinalis]|jgi:hypothetical protein|uniref:hypothetical protein n=1 Tax=Senimuribacter intestinalis TaxID=2941507 RepID=UPI00203BBBCA|nr:hypothetical protein [Senimuribacter intestinalis]